MNTPNAHRKPEALRLSNLVRRGALAAATLAMAGCASPPAVPTVQIWEEYLEAPDTHPNIPNGSYAGYRYGEEALPHIEGPVYNVRDFGAAGDGEQNDQPAIRAALEAVGPEGGVVFFPRGRYRIDGVLFVHTDRTVLRGEDREGVELVFTRPLAAAWARRELPPSRPLNDALRTIVEQIRSFYGDIIFEGDMRRASAWSWSGGLIWFTPRERATYREDPSEPVTGSIEGWLMGEPLATVAESARRGERAVVLDTEPDLAPGDFVILRQADPGDFSFVRHLSGDGPWADAYDWSQDNSAGFPSGYPRPVRWAVEVAAIDGRTLTFRQPLRFDVRAEWNPEIVPIEATIRESGLEHMTLRFERQHTWEVAGHNIYPGWNGPWFNNAIHCWMRGVTLVNVDNGPGTSASKCITMMDFRLEADRPEMMAQHHATHCRNDSHDVLFHDFQILSKPAHGLNTEQQGTGLVWSRGVMAHGTFDTHRMLPFENIRTEIVLNNDGFHGGTGGPAMGARFVHWNIEVTNDRDYIVGWANAMPRGAIVGLRGVPVNWESRPEQTPVGEVSETRVEATGEVPNPPNLFEAQVRHRLGNLPEHLRR